MASMPVPRIVLDRLMAALAIVALGSSKQTSTLEGQTEESTVELVSSGLCSSNEAPMSEKTDNAGMEEMEEADVSLLSMMEA